MAAGFVALVGLMYIGLGIWCALDPATTSSKVGFVVQPGSGQSEFLTVYGGLEFGIGLFLLAPLVHAEWTRSTLMACLLIHGSLVAFRTAGFFLFDRIGGFTWKLAAGEWVIFLVSLGLWLYQPASSASQAS